MTAPHDIKLLLSDVDGTLVTKDKVLTEAARDAAQALKAAGIGFALTSSRPARGMRMLVEPLGLTTPLGGFNGGALTEPDLTLIESLPIDPQAARQVVDLFLKDGLDVWVYTVDRWFVRDVHAPHVEREAWIIKFDAEAVPEFKDEHLAHAIKIVGVSDDFALVERGEKAAQDLLGANASATRSAAYFIDVTNPKATKGCVVHTLAKRLDVAPSEIATIGDMQNDVLMFRESGFSIAMGNADDEVKSQASAVTDTNENDGWAKAVRRFLLKADAA